MRHHQKQNFVYPSERLPPLLAVDDPLRDRDIQRVIKYPAGGFKADAMLPLIREVLGFIPLKENAIHSIKCTYIFIHMIWRTKYAMQSYILHGYHRIFRKTSIPQSDRVDPGSADDLHCHPFLLPRAHKSAARH